MVRDIFQGHVGGILDLWMLQMILWLSPVKISWSCHSRTPRLDRTFERDLQLKRLLLRPLCGACRPAKKNAWLWLSGLQLKTFHCSSFEHDGGVSLDLTFLFSANLTDFVCWKWWFLWHTWWFETCFDVYIKHCGYDPISLIFFKLGSKQLTIWLYIVVWNILISLVVMLSFLFKRVKRKRGTTVLWDVKSVTIENHLFEFAAKHAHFFYISHCFACFLHGYPQVRCFDAAMSPLGCSDVTRGAHIESGKRRKDNGRIMYRFIHIYIYTCRFMVHGSNIQFSCGTKAHMIGGRCL